MAMRRLRKRLPWDEHGSGEIYGPTKNHPKPIAVCSFLNQTQLNYQDTSGSSTCFNYSVTLHLSCASASSLWQIRLSKGFTTQCWWPWGPAVGKPRWCQWSHVSSMTMFLLQFLLQNVESISTGTGLGQGLQLSRKLCHKFHQEMYSETLLHSVHSHGKSLKQVGATRAEITES